MKLTKEQIGEMVRFSIVGVLITVIHYAVYWLLQLVINVNIAWTAGYIVGFVVNYYLSARYIFREKATAQNGAGFGGAHLVNYFLQMGLLNFFLWLGWSAEWAPVGVYSISIPVNFLLVRFVFKKLK
ncbi:MAG: GtrA family protein [Prevotella sp.]|nr:GtrA family protein [Prevotella sp.]